MVGINKEKQMKVKITRASDGEEVIADNYVDYINYG